MNDMLTFGLKKSENFCLKNARMGTTFVQAQIENGYFAKFLGNRT